MNLAPLWPKLLTGLFLLALFVAVSRQKRTDPFDLFAVMIMILLARDPGMHLAEGNVPLVWKRENE